MDTCQKKLGTVSIGPATSFIGIHQQSPEALFQKDICVPMFIYLVSL